MPDPKSPREELRALLFGEPPYERFTAPEPQLLLELAPLMSREQVVRAAERLHWLGAVDERTLKRILAPVLSRLPRSEAGLLVDPLFRIPQLADPLPLPLLRAALPAVRAREWDEARRLEVLAEIAARLPRPREREALVEEVLDAARSLSAADRAHVLARLAAATTGELRRELDGAALHEALAGGDPHGTLAVLAENALLSGEPVPPEVLRAAREAEPRSYGLALVAPVLDGEGLDRALEEIRDFHAGPGPGNPAEMLAPFLDRPRLERVLALVRESGAGPEARAALLAALAPRLPAALAEEAAEIALSLEEPWWRGMALRALLPRLPAGRREELAGEAEAYAPERIGTLARRLPAAERERLVDEVLDDVMSRYGGAQAAAAPPPGIDFEPGEKGFGFRAGDEEDVGLAGSWSGGSGETDSLDEADFDVEPEPAESAPPPRAAAPPAPAPPPPIPPPSERLVNTGFAEPGSADEPIDPARALLPDRTYLFWLEVGSRQAGAIEERPVALPVEKLPPEAHLRVVLFGFEDGFRVTPGQEVGGLRIRPDGRVVVEEPVATPASGAGMLDRRLLFPVATPPDAGVARLRCNVYCGGVLVQSHLVEARVGEAAGEGEGPALRARSDFILCRSLRAERLAMLRPHRLSLLLNDNGNGTHGLRLFGSDGEEEFRGDATLSGQELQNLIEKAREALRMAAWGSGEPWQDQAYRYEGPPDRERLRADLVRLAKIGYRVYDHLVGRLAGGGASRRAEIRERVKRLRALMRTPGMVQIASKEQVRHLVPAAVLYDHPLDTTLPAASYALCPGFEAALDAGEPLAGSVCFGGECPSREEGEVVCPSGFWGFRHGLGMPVSVGGSLADAAFEIRLRGSPRLGVAVSTDPLFVRRAGHEQALRGLRATVEWLHADTRDEALDLMSTGSPHLVYFYCHGGVADDVPYLLVGAPGTERGITRDLLRQRDIFWEDPQPLVLINGCHTTALEPEKALDLVSGFVETANAAGVIGTEITIFEPIACAFGEEFLRHFLSGVPVGEAVRLARLRLLADENPLGLVYLPFVLASLALREEGEGE